MIDKRPEHVIVGDMCFACKGIGKLLYDPPNMLPRVIECPMCAGVGITPQWTDNNSCCE